MTEADEEDVEEAVAEVEEADDAPEPELSDDDVAEVDPNVAAKVAEADAEETDEDDDNDDETTETTDRTTTTTERSTSIGHVYCRTLGAGAAIGRDRHGNLTKDRSDAIDEYANLAKDLDIDDYVDEWAEQNLGNGDEMTPGQGMIVMTTVFTAMVFVDDDELLDSAIDQAGDLGLGDDSAEVSAA